MHSPVYRRFLVYFAVLQVIGGLCPFPIQAQCDSEIRIKVLSLNLRHGETLEGKSNLAGVFTLINTIDPDIALIQEVDRNVPRSSYRDQPRILAEGTDMVPTFTPTLPSYRGGEYGLLLLSRTPPVDSDKHSLPHKETGEMRLIQEARIDIRRTFTILIYHTHLGVDSPRDIRIEQINSLKNRFHHDHYDAVIVAGDLNISGHSWAHASLKDAYRETAPADFEGTYPAQNPSIELDHIFFQTELPAEVLRFHAVYEPILSDHLPIYAEIGFCIDSH